MTWEEEWTEKFANPNFIIRLSPKLKYHENREALKEIEDFVRTQKSLSVQETLDKVRAKAEALRRGPTLCGNCNLNGPLCEECYANRRANSTLDTLLLSLTPSKQNDS